VCGMLPVSLNCPFFIVPSVFSNIYFYILYISFFRNVLHIYVLANCIYSLPIKKILHRYLKEISWKVYAYCIHTFEQYYILLSLRFSLTFTFISCILVSSEMFCIKLYTYTYKHIFLLIYYSIPRRYILYMDI
jgi:hypothetical protein